MRELRLGGRKDPMLVLLAGIVVGTVGAWLLADVLVGLVAKRLPPGLALADAVTGAGAVTYGTVAVLWPGRLTSWVAFAALAALIVGGLLVVRWHTQHKPLAGS
jgi:hypothetical protein